MAMTRPIGHYNQRVRIVRRTTQKGPTGAPQNPIDTPIGARWAHALPQKTREFEQLLQRYAEITAAYHIRGYLAVQVGDKLVHDGQELDIIGVETLQNRVPERAEEITLGCRGRR